MNESVSFLTKTDDHDRNYLGFGLGLRADHYQDVSDYQGQIDWLEIISENYLVPGGKPLHFLDKIRAEFPMVMHGVSMSVGSTDPLDMDYLRQLKELAARVEPAWLSDHLCFTGLENTNLHDLLPLPYTEEAIRHVVERISRVQDYLGRQILIENVSSYLTYQQSVMSEWDFLSEISARADCLVLLDINNIYVSSHNHKFDPVEYLDGVPAARVQQFHLAGHSYQGSIIVDTHDQQVIDPVWELYQQALARFGRVSTMIERDDNIPPLVDLVAELQHARALAATALGD